MTVEWRHLTVAGRAAQRSADVHAARLGRLIARETARGDRAVQMYAMEQEIALSVLADQYEAASLFREADQ